MGYLALKVVHIVAVICWMAGLLYLYRLFVYHREETEPVVRDRLRVMARRLWRAITVPAAWVTLLSGAGLLLARACLYLPSGWMSLKLLLVLLLVCVHLYGGRLCAQLLRDQTPHLSGKALRWLNEAPTVLMIAIVSLVVFQPNWFFVHAFFCLRV